MREVPATKGDLKKDNISWNICSVMALRMRGRCILRGASENWKHLPTLLANIRVFLLRTQNGRETTTGNVQRRLVLEEELIDFSETNLIYQKFVQASCPAMGFNRYLFCPVRLNATPSQVVRHGSVSRHPWFVQYRGGKLSRFSKVSSKIRSKYRHFYAATTRLYFLVKTFSVSIYTMVELRWVNH